MYMRRFIGNPTDIFKDKIVISDKKEVNHIKNVLRMEVGEPAIITDSYRYEYDATLSALTPTSVIFDIRNKRKSANDPQNRITLFQCMPKQGKLDLIIQKAVELGVYAIHPVYSERSVVKKTENDEKKQERWNKISAEAVKQCRRTAVPFVFRPIEMKMLPHNLEYYDYIIMPYENESGVTLRDILREIKTKQDVSTIAVIIGPEGGFTDKEEELITSCAAFRCSLGRTILRTETAAIATIAMIMYELELDLV